jgi:hypothetical protein
MVEKALFWYFQNKAFKFVVTVASTAAISHADVVSRGRWHRR